jgi:hypothetical protein
MRSGEKIKGACPPAIYLNAQLYDFLYKEV